MMLKVVIHMIGGAYCDFTSSEEKSTWQERIISALPDGSVSADNGTKSMVVPARNILFVELIEK